MNELTLDGKLYVSSKRAAEMTGYAKDYVGQLCREGRVEARLVGRNWYILKSAIEKHRFAGEDAAILSDSGLETSSQSWEKPRYKPEAATDLPSINRLTAPGEALEANEQVVVEEPTTIEAMQDAWHGWFARSAVQEESMEVAKDEEILEEAPNDLLSDEISIPLKHITPVVEEPQMLNLRRIREYTPEEADEDVEEGVIITERAAGKSLRSHYGIFQAVFLAIALIAISVGYIGAGLFENNGDSYKPVNLIAGVAVYNQDK
jgi:hypothetical protein